MSTPRAASVCSEAGCTAPAHARGMCQTHYGRGRHRHRDDQLLRQRARNRATARLVDLHREEFERLWEEERLLVEDEARRIAERVDLRDEPAKPTTVRLRPGPRARIDADDPAAKVREDVGSCARCIGYHDRGHRCEECGRAPNEARPVVPLQKTPEQKIEDLLRRGKTAQWITANTGEPAVLVRRVLERLKGSGVAS